MTPQQGSEPWMPNGFPPPSFVVETERTRGLAGPRGRWLAAAAILGAILLIAGVVLIANQGDDQTALNTGATSSTLGGTGPTFPNTGTLDPTATSLEATTVPGGGGGTTVPGASTTAGPTTTAGRPAAGPGVLEASTATVTLPTAAPFVGKVTLKNAGASPLTYSTRSNLPSILTVDRSNGTIAPGASTEVTITLDGSKAPEGSVPGKLAFDSNGGNKVVDVVAKIARPPVINENVGEPCGTASRTCSKQIKVVTQGANPCTGRWQYSVTVSDESGQLKSVKADAARKKGTETTNVDADLKIDGRLSGPAGKWQSDVFDPILAGSTLTFTLEAIDTFDAAGRSDPPTREIVCP